MKTQKIVKTGVSLNKILVTLSVLVVLGFTTFIAAYAPAREYFFGSFASSPSYKTSDSTILKNKLPITGTFITPDLFYKSEAEYRSFYKELSDTGIDTVVLMLTSQLKKDCTSKKYTEDIDYRLYAGNPQFIPTSVKLAKEFNIKIYFSVAQYNEEGNQRICFNYLNGSVSNENTDMGRLLGFTSRTMSAIKNMVQTKTPVAWEDPTIAGFYLFPEVDTIEFARSNSPRLAFFVALSNLVKAKEPTKKVMISSFQSEQNGYSAYLQAYSNLMKNTKIDVYAPQDSMGSQLTRTPAKSSEHFKALRDANTKFPGHEVWANIETFSKDYVLGTRYGPSDALKVAKQIDAAKPYVAKMITWMYTHTMLVNPLSDNKLSENQYAVFYRPEYAVKRLALRSGYLALSGAVNWKVTSVKVGTSEASITGTFGQAGTSSIVQFVYVNTAGKLVRLNETVNATGSNQTIMISKSRFQDINSAKPYTAHVSMLSGPVPTNVAPTAAPTTRVSRTPTPTVTGRWYPF